MLVERGEGVMEGSCHRSCSRRPSWRATRAPTTTRTDGGGTERPARAHSAPAILLRKQENGERCTTEGGEASRN